MKILEKIFKRQRLKFISLALVVALLLPGSLLGLLAGSTFNTNSPGIVLAYDPEGPEGLPGDGGSGNDPGANSSEGNAGAIGGNNSGSTGNNQSNVGFFGHIGHTLDGLLGTQSLGNLGDNIDAAIDAAMDAIGDTALGQAISSVTTALGNTALGHALAVAFGNPVTAGALVGVLTGNPVLGLVTTIGFGLVNGDISAADLADAGLNFVDHMLGLPPGTSADVVGALSGESAEKKAVQIALFRNNPDAPCYVVGCSCSYSEDVVGAPCGQSAPCYKDAVCERQSDNMCGWTYTSKINECLKNTGGLAYTQINISQCSGSGNSQLAGGISAKINCLKNLLSKAKDNLRLARHDNHRDKINQAVMNINEIIKQITLVRDQQYEAEIAPLKQKLRELEEQLNNARDAADAWRIQQEINDVKRDIRRRENSQNDDFGDVIKPRPERQDTSCTSTYEVKDNNCNTFDQAYCTETIHVMCHPSKKLKEIKKRKIKNPWYGEGP